MEEGLGKGRELKITSGTAGKRKGSGRFNKIRGTTKIVQN